MTETLILAIPVYDKVHCAAWQSHMKLTARLSRQFPSSDLAFAYQHGLPQPHAQNMLIRKCLNMKMNGKRADWILWVEGDTLPPEDSFERLRAHADPETAPVIHGLSCDREYPYNASAWRLVQNEQTKGIGLSPINDWEPDTLYKVGHSGTCLTLFHTSVFDRIKEPWFRMRPFLQGDYKGTQCCLSLSARLHGAGIPIYVDSGCPVPHMADAFPVDPGTRKRNSIPDVEQINPISIYAEELQKEFAQSTTSI